MSNAFLFDTRTERDSFIMGPDYTIFRFAKTDGIVASTDLVNAGFSRVIKIYVGDGSSLENDQAVLDMYLVDTNW